MLDEGLYLPVRFYSNLQFQDYYLEHCYDILHREYVVASCSSLLPFQYTLPYDGVTTVDLTQSTIKIVNLDGVTPVETDITANFTATDWEQWNDPITAMTYISYLGSVTSFTVNSGLSYFKLLLKDSNGVSLPTAYSERFLVTCDCDGFGSVFETGEYRRWASQIDLRKSDVDDLRIVKE